MIYVIKINNKSEGCIESAPRKLRDVALPARASRRKMRWPNNTQHGGDVKIIIIVSLTSSKETGRIRGSMPGA